MRCGDSPPWCIFPEIPFKSSFKLLTWDSSSVFTFLVWFCDDQSGHRAFSRTNLFADDISKDMSEQQRRLEASTFYVEFPWQDQNC
jgi:hypothetical protein